MLAGIVVWLRWSDLDLGQRVYICAFSVVFATAWMYVPFSIPTTGAVVHGFVWQRVEYADPLAQKILTPETVAQVEREVPSLRSREWVRRSIMRQAPVSVHRHRVYLLTPAFFGVAGWFVIPPLFRIWPMHSRD